LRVLRLKFQWTPEALREAEPQMNAIARKVAPTRIVDVVKDDPVDNRILECAAESKSEYIVTGDGDLLRVGMFNEMPIVRLADIFQVMGYS
jgi:predicted nucleic acid-binding protein